MIRVMPGLQYWMWSHQLVTHPDHTSRSHKGCIWLISARRPASLWGSRTHLEASHGQEQLCHRVGAEACHQGVQCSGVHG